MLAMTGSVTITESRFIQSGSYYEGSPTRADKDWLNALQENVVPGALHNSAERFDAPKCHPKTRIGVLSRIKKWFHIRPQRRRCRPIMWLKGPAGAGKTAIAQTMAEEWDSDGTLAASFFFSRSAQAASVKTHLMSTIAYQLLRSFPDARLHLEKAIADDPLIFKKSLAVQMQELILRPLLNVIKNTSSQPSPPKVVVIDGLDECTGEGAQQEILSVFTDLLNQPDVPLVLFVTSRPEHQIRQAFEGQSVSQLTSRVALDERIKPERDIEVFVRMTFDEIKDAHSMDDSSWPPEEAIQTIVRKSSGQFIYTSTVMKYLGAPHNDPRRCLEVVLGVQGPGQDAPFTELDALYTYILSSVAPSSYEVAMDVFAFLQSNIRDVWDGNTGIHHLNNSIVPFVERVLYMDYHHIYRHLIDLHSILLVPAPRDSKAQSLRFYHASFGDFLADRSRSKKFFLDSQEAAARISRCFLKNVLAVTALGDFTPDWLYWLELKDETFRHLKHACPDRSLRACLEAVMRSDPRDYLKLLEDMEISQSAGIERRTLLEVLDNCKYKTEVIKYLKRCHKAQEPNLLWRLTADMRLIPYLLEVFLSSCVCTSNNCSKHCRQRPPKVMKLVKKLLA